MLLIIGLDGATFDLLDPWVEMGHLPNIARLLAESSSRVLLSTVPPVTPCAWTSFATGAQPERHGVYSFHRFQPGTYTLELTHAASALVPTVWRYLNQAGLSVGLLNVPWTYPPDRALQGWVIAGGLESPGLSPAAVHPPSLWDEIRTAVGAPPIDRPSNEPTFVTCLEDQIGWQGAVAGYLLERHRPDVFMTVFSATDRVQHRFWQERKRDTNEGATDDVLLRIYARVDAELGELLKQTGDRGHVWLMSDHGAGICRGALNVNRALADAGLLAFPAGSAGRDRLGEALNAVRRSPLFIPVRRLAKTLGLGRWGVARGLDQFANRMAADWSRTRAFCWGQYGSLCIHSVGRFPQGTVSAEEHEQAISAVREALLALRDPRTSDCLIAEVRDIREAQTEAVRQTGPDLLATAAGYAYELIPRFRPDVPLVLTPQELPALNWPEMQGTHRLEGIFAARGPNVCSGQRLGPAQIVDCAPAMLQIHGLAPPPDMDGRPMGDLFGETAMKRLGPVRAANAIAEPSPQGAYSEEEAGTLERRLQDLGYLE